jgi:hypothetical protein
LQRGFSSKNAEIPRIIPLTEYLEYFQKRQARKPMKLKAGDGDRTRDVQLGKWTLFVYPNTSLFKAFKEGYAVAPSQRESGIRASTGTLREVTTHLLA